MLWLSLKPGSAVYGANYYIQEVQSLGRTGTREAKLFELSPPALSYVVWWPAFLPECLRGREIEILILSGEKEVSQFS